MNIQIRLLNKNEHSFLKEMFYQAFYIPEDEDPLPKDIILSHQLPKYIEKVGKTGDYFLIAEYKSGRIDTDWCQLFNEKNSGYSL